ncbi:MAG: hypothetical protein JKY37_00605 [Nannocystaceae bacterium]|nr:hypothetical protein [Nannocystaceae bacterium]
MAFSFTAVLGLQVSCGPTLGDSPAATETTDTSSTTTDGAPTTTDSAPTTTDRSSSTGRPSADGLATTEAEPPSPPDCVEGTVQDRWLHIDGTTLDERDKLQGVTVVDGSLVIYRVPDTDLSFLQCVRRITGDLHIYDNDSLLDVSGLAWVEEVGGDIIIVDNDALVSFDALTQVAELGDTEIPSGDPSNPHYLRHHLIIANNESLERIEGLSSLQYVFGDFIIRDNPSLISIDGLVGVVGVGNILAINHNASLCISNVNALGDLIEAPSSPPPGWTTQGNNEDC